MSLFSSRDYWSTRLGTEEEFDQGGVCVGNIDNDPTGHGDGMARLRKLP